MKRNKPISIDQKVIIVHSDGVSEDLKQKVQKKYPNALVKSIHVNDVLREAIEFKKRVTCIVYMPGVAEEAKESSKYWEGCRVINAETELST